MEAEFSERLREALNQIDRPGSFCASGSVPLVLPGLEVEGLGPIGLPLNARQAEELRERCDQAPYGKGEETIVDTNVRRVWRMEPGRFALTNPDWGGCLAEVVTKVQEELGLEKQKLEAHLHDLLLYEPGGFFLPHRDGEKRDRMVATLVVVLPSAHEGGEIVVRHDGEERTIDLGGVGRGVFQIHYAAFYADCEHEVRPLREGHRLCLVYNLTLAKSKKPLTAPRVSEHIQAIAPLLGAWSAGDSAGKLVVLLDHRYTRDGLAWDALKGVDRARARVLCDAARQAGCMAYLGLLTFWESGSAEYAGGRRSRSGSRGGRRWGYGYDEYEGDADDYEMGEVFESSLTADHLSDAEGNGLPIGELTVEEDEILEPEELTEIDPEVEFEGYTGNAGMTLEHWYRHAAILIWPERRHFAILCDRESRDVVPALDQMVARWRRPGLKGDARAALKAQCIELATAILARWSERPYDEPYAEGTKTGGLLGSLDALDEPALIGRFLGDVMVKDVTVDPGESLAKVCQEHGWGTFREPLRALMEGTSAESLGRNVRLLEHLCLARPGKKPGWGELCADLAGALVTAMETVDRRPASSDWRAREVDRAGVLAALARALIVTGQFDLLSRVVDHALATPKKYPLILAHVPALVDLRPWLKRHLKEPCAAINRWVTSCREQLETLRARAREPADFRRAAPVTCKCEDCAELKQFLMDPGEATHRFSVRQDRRKHLEHTIRDDKCDLQFTTEKKRSPHTLVCTKSTASYQESLKTYHQNQERFETIRSIESDLPR